MSEGLSFTLTEEQEAFRRSVRELAQDKISPRAAEIDEAAQQDFATRNVLMSNALPGGASPVAGAVIGSGGEMGMEPETEEPGLGDEDADGSRDPGQRPEGQQGEPDLESAKGPQLPPHRLVPARGLVREPAGERQQAAHAAHLLEEGGLLLGLVHLCHEAFCNS